jgi:hypothetical protein
MSYRQHYGINPFAGHAESDITSDTLDLRAAAAWSLSWYTTSGTTSAHTLQISNWAGRREGSSVQTGWVSYATFGAGTPGLISPPAGVRYARVLRSASSASVQIDIAVQDGC